MTVGERLKELRLGAGLRVDEVATKANVPVNNLYCYERGVTLPSLGSLALLAKALKVKLRAFEGCTFETDRRRRVPRAKTST